MNKWAEAGESHRRLRLLGGVLHGEPADILPSGTVYVCVCVLCVWVGLNATHVLPLIAPATTTTTMANKEQKKNKEMKENYEKKALITRSQLSDTWHIYAIITVL